jgi:hypothetical protein
MSSMARSFGSKSPPLHSVSSACRSWLDRRLLRGTPHNRRLHRCLLAGHDAPLRQGVDRRRPGALVGAPRSRSRGASCRHSRRRIRSPFSARVASLSVRSLTMSRSNSARPAKAPHENAADFEVMQMTIEPAHGSLKGVVQGLEREVGRDLDAPPDGRIDVEERNVKAGDHVLHSVYFTCAWAPIPGQKLVDPIGGMIGDAGDDIDQIGLWVEASHLRRLDDRVHDRGSSSARVGAHK